jgi:hypothetical protein
MAKMFAVAVGLYPSSNVSATTRWLRGPCVNTGMGTFAST